jgi:hypothetical protein
MKWIIGIGLSFVLFVYVNIHYGEEYKVVGKIIDKGMTSNRDGNIAYYHTLVQYEDGSTEDIEGIDDYIKLEKGVRYTFTKSRLNFHKK